MTALGRHFALAEFTRSPAGVSAGIENAPNDEQIVALRVLVGQVLDPLRDALGVPVRVTSGFRSRALNTLIGGSKTSQHCYGEAADIKASGFTAADLCARIAHLGLEFDQVIWYDPERGGHVHVSYTIRRPNRRQILHAPVTGGYSPWIVPSIH